MWTGERLSPWVAVGCLTMGVSIIFFWEKQLFVTHESTLWAGLQLKDDTKLDVRPTLLSDHELSFIMWSFGLWQAWTLCWDMFLALIILLEVVIPLCQQVWCCLVLVLSEHHMSHYLHHLQLSWSSSGSYHPQDINNK